MIYIYIYIYHVGLGGVNQEGPLGGLPNLSLSIKCSWIHLLGEGRLASHQLSDASTPSSPGKSYTILTNHLSQLPTNTQSELLYTGPNV